MPATSRDLSGIDELRDRANALAKVRVAIGDISANWFVIGAAARDLILHHGCGLPIERMTEDIDVAVAVATWSEFQRISDRLIELGYESAPAKQRFLLGDAILDIVPFGRLERDGRIGWPPEGQPVMNVLGFEEVSENCDLVALPGNVTVRIPTIVGLTILKCLAWADRHFERPHHDALDLRQLIVSYSAPWNLDALYGRGLKWVETFEYEIEAAGAALLGSDMRGVAREATLVSIEETLGAEKTRDQLALDMRGDVDANVRLVDALLYGFRSS